MKNRKPNTAPDAPDAEAVSRRAFLRQGAYGAAGTLLAANTLAACGADRESAPGTPDSAHRPFWSTANRAPLLPTPFSALPLGSIRARGWLLHQLELQRDGLTGQAEGVLPAVSADSAWRGGPGEGWEKGPYYLKGLVALAYTLDDAGLKAKAQPWIEGMIQSQRPDGFFGPASDTDWWPRMVATYALRDYAEATNDPRVVPLLSRYHQYMASKIGASPLREWGKARAGDQIDTLFWLYNRTGDASLLPLADTLHAQAYDWQDIFTHNRFLEFGDDYQPKHAVNVPQALKMPPVYWQRSRDPADRAAFGAGVANLMRDHGLSMGINSGTEFLAGRSTTQGVELCSIVERMLSDETAVRILGDASIGDNLELLAFNALPAALTKDIHQHVYFTLPNNVTAPRGSVGYNQDYDNGRTPAACSGFPCCCYNFHMGWPKFAQASWAQAEGGGLAAIAYAPTEVSAFVAGGTRVRITTDTDYPFRDQVKMTLDTPHPVRFPLHLRIPAWCRTAHIAVNGTAQPAPAPGTFAVLDRLWQPGDIVTLTLPMSVETVPGVDRTVSVRRGPLLYALQIKENWKQLEPGPRKGFETYQVTPASDWNYGLVVDPNQPAAAFAVAQTAMPLNPFVQAQTPVALRVHAKKVPAWTLAWNSHVAFDPPARPAAAPAPAELVTLVPFGAEMLRVTDFPVLSTHAPVLGTHVPVASSFHDTFASGHADDWLFYGGGWHVQGGALRPVSNAGGSSSGMAGVKAVAVDTHFADFVYDADVAVGAQGNAGVIFRVDKPGIGADAYAGYYAGISAETGQLILGKSANSWTQLQAVSVSIAANKPYRLRVRAEGPHLRVYLGDMTRPAIDLQDTSCASGAVGVRQYNTSPEKTAAAFSGIRVAAV